MNHIKINQNTQITEYTTIDILEYLYEKFSGEINPTESTEIILDNTSELEGNVTVPGIYKFMYDWLTTKFNKLRINYQEMFLYIKDPYIKAKLLENNFGDITGNHVTYSKSFAATSLPNFGIIQGYSEYETNITEFNELAEFTNVTSLEQNFRMCKNLVSVDLKNVTRLNSITFYRSGIKYCYNSGNITFIAGQCFEDCINLESFDFSSVKTLGWYSFKGSGITEAHFGGYNDITFGNDTFKECKQLTTVDGLQNLTSINVTGLFRTCTSLTEIRLDNLETIGSDTFSGCTNLTTIYIPNISGSIPGSLFRDCSNLTNLTINWNNITSIGNYAFKGCSKIQTIDISNVVSITGTNQFENCSALKNIGTLNSVIRSIPESMFYRCSSLTSIDLSHITSLGNGCFNRCTSLTSIGCNLSNVTTLSNGGIFSGCSNLRCDINFSNVENINQITYMFTDSGITSFIGSSSFISIGQDTFKNCKNLTSFSCPNVTTLGESCFNGCTELITFNAPLLNNVGKSAFENCTKLTSLGNAKPTIIQQNAFKGSSINVDLSECTLIGQNAFYGNSGLTSIDLSNVTNMDYGNTYGGATQFDNAINLTSVIYSNTLTYIPWYCFRSTKISSITNLGNIKKIGGYAFNNCINLTSIDLDSVEEIDRNAFYGCSNLANIGNTSNLKTISSSVFNGTCISSINLENVETIESNNFGGLTSLNTPITMKKIQSLGGTLFHGSINIPYLVLDISTLPTKGNLSFGNQISGMNWHIYITDSLYDEALELWNSSEYNLSTRLKNLSTLQQ